MSVKKPSKSLGRYNPNLIARIDSMDDDSEFNPYSANKRQTITESELFDNEEYLDEDEAQDELFNQSKSGGSSALPAIIAGLLIVGCLAGVIFMVSKYFT